MSQPLQILHLGEKFRDALAGELDGTVGSPSDRQVVLDRIGNGGEPVDAVVCEHHPPALEAPAFVAAVRSESESVPVVLLVEEGSESLAAAATSAGATEYVSLGTNADGTAEAADVVEKRARERRRSRTRFEPRAGERHLVEQNLVGVYELRGEQFTYVNPEFAETFGYAQEDLIGESPFDVLVDRQEGKLRENLGRLARGEVETLRAEYAGVHADGHEVVVEAHGRLIEEPPDPMFLGFIRDISERKRRERRFEAVFNNTYQFTGLMEPDGTLLEANETALSFGGLDREEVVGKPVWEAGWFQASEETRETAREAVERAREGELFRDEVRVRGAERELVIDFSVRPITDEQGEVTLLIPEGRNVTERKRREQRSAGLNDALADLIEAESPAEVCEVVTGAAERLELPVLAVALVDAEAGQLRPTAATGAAEAHLATDRLFDQDGGTGWEAFVTGTAVDLEPPETDLLDADAGVDELSVHPLGRHGVLVAGSTLSDGPFVGTLAESVRRTLDRIDREKRLQRREEQLEEQNEALERLNRVNELIRAIDRRLVSASTREEVERAVCEELAAEDAYSFAWIGEYEPATGRIEPREGAGDGAEYLASATFTTGDGTTSPPERAVATREPQVMDDAFTEPPFEPWREAALSRGFRSSVAVPLRYRDSLYGVLDVYASRPGAFDELEREVLAELGETVAGAINAVESKRALVSDEVVELDLGVGETGTGIEAFVREAPERELELDGVVPVEGDTFRVYYRITGASPEAVLAYARRSPAIKDSDVIAERDGECQVAFALTEESLIFWLIDHGARPRSVSVTDEGVRVGVELAGDADVRDFVELFRATYPDSELLARRRRERPFRSRHEFEAAFEEALTPRQREVLRTAYHSGYFETPRDRSGEEIAHSMDISQPTFSDHLRTGQRNLFDLLFGNLADPNGEATDDG